MSNPTISSITLPSGTTYDIEDTAARLAAAGAIHIIGSTSDTIVDGASTPTSVTLTGETEAHTMAANEAVTNGNKEFVWNGSKWIEMGDLSGLGSLAFKNSASGNFTPSGSIAVNAASGSGTSYTPEGSIAVNDSSGTGTEYTPEGSVSAPTISVDSAGSTASVTPFGSAGSLPSLTMTVSSKNLAISFDQGSLPSGGTAVTVKTGDASYSASAPTFTGTKKKLAFTGTEKKLAFSGTQGNVSVS